jgi:hypothetical protein
MAATSVLGACSLVRSVASRVGRLELRARWKDLYCGSRAECHVRTGAGVSTASRARLDVEPGAPKLRAKATKSGLPKPVLLLYLGAGSIFQSISLRVWQIRR